MKSYNVIITACKDGAQSRIKDMYNRERKRSKMQCFPFCVKRKNSNEKQGRIRNPPKTTKTKKLRKKMYGFKTPPQIHTRNPVKKTELISTKKTGIFCFIRNKVEEKVQYPIPLHNYYFLFV